MNKKYFVSDYIWYKLHIKIIRTQNESLFIVVKLKKNV